MRALWQLVTILQAVLGARMLARLVASANGTRIERTSAIQSAESISVLVPVLNEDSRLGPCLEGLISQGPEVAEILVIDGGSTDGTRDLVGAFAGRDARIRLVDSTPVPDAVNGKAWNLMMGAEQASPDTTWILTIDADVRPEPVLASSLLAHAGRTGVAAFSVATRQVLSGKAEGILHPSMLATLVYRFGIPGRATTDPAQVQANGQCFLVRKDILNAASGFSAVLESVCEDVTIARAIAEAGHPVGFYESDACVSVEMYQGWRDAWDNWSRSLPMRDRRAPFRTEVGMVEILLLQALPPWRLLRLLREQGPRHPATVVNVVLTATRMGMLAGMARAYQRRPWTYWLSPIVDLPVVIRLWSMAWRRRFTWRGRTFGPGVSR